MQMTIFDADTKSRLTTRSPSSTTGEPISGGFLTALSPSPGPAERRGSRLVSEIGCGRMAMGINIDEPFRAGSFGMTLMVRINDRQPWCGAKPTNDFYRPPPNPAPLLLACRHSSAKPVPDLSRRDCLMAGLTGLEIASCCNCLLTDRHGHVFYRDASLFM